MLVGVAACGSGPGNQPAKTTPVSLSLRGAPKQIDIGVVVTLTSEPGQGADWSTAAEGAGVAGYRYREGGLDVRIVPVNDEGTSDGAAAAVRRLVAKKVAGIVLATEGSHLSGALDAAGSTGVPVLLPYSTDTSDLGDDAWLTGPDNEQVGEAMGTALDEQSVDRPLLVDAGGGTPDGLVTTRRITFDPVGDPANLARRVQRLTDKGPQVDGVVVSGPTEVQAELVAGLQGRDLGIPVLLTPQALSPRFAPDLDEAGGSLAADLTTVGIENGDTAALQPGARGVTASAFLAALRSAAEDRDLTDFFDDQPFRTVAADADTRSHDAVVALVHASAAAGSTQPDEVAAALTGLRLTSEDGLGGPDLAFDEQHTALGATQVVTLTSTPQGVGLRPGDGSTPQLSWFSSPAR